MKLRQTLLFAVRKTEPLTIEEMAQVHAGLEVNTTPILKRWAARSKKNRLSDIVNILPLSKGTGLKLCLVACLALAGCASFSSLQTDFSYEDGKPARTITTKTSASTLFSAKSDLARYRASTSDKAQTLGIGSLNQEATNNLEVIIGAAVGAAVSAAKKP